MRRVCASAARCLAVSPPPPSTSSSVVLYTSRALASNKAIPFFVRKHNHKSRRVPNTLYTSSSSTSSSSTPSTSTLSFNALAGKKRKGDETAVALPPLRCPGGPRVKAEGIKYLYKVPHAGYLAKYDHRFLLNLKLTHQLASYLSRTTLKAQDKVLVELGPGVGSLTRSLLTRPCVGVLGIEKDARFNVHLEQIRQYTEGKFRWVNADVLACDELALLREAFPRFVAQNLRRPPASAADTNNNNNNKEEEEEEGEGSTECEGDDEGYEGAPLRSAARERILRRRAQQQAQAQAHSTNNSEQEAGAVMHTSPNPAFDITDHWWADGEAKVEVIANLPFDIITEVLMRYAVDCANKTGLFRFGRVPVHVFTQHEVAERITAVPGSVQFSRLSVLCQCYFHVRCKQTFAEWTYYPRTEVLGAMLTLEPRTVPLVRGLDAATLIHFTDLLMKPGMRGRTVHKALVRFMPPEVGQYVLQELRMDGALTVLDLTVKEVAEMAVLWRRFLEASNQQQQKQQEQQQQQEKNTRKEGEKKAQQGQTESGAYML